jgi:cardiolipin synthase
VPLAAIILGRDVLLSLSAFYIRYSSLPSPVRRVKYVFNFSKTLLFDQKTFSRYWDFSLPSAEVRPTGISKVSIPSFVSHSLPHPAQVNTALQLLLMGMTTVTPILPINIGLQLHGLQ